MPLTPEELQELEALEAEFKAQGINPTTHKMPMDPRAYQPTEEDKAEALRMTGVGEEGILKSAAIGLGRAPMQLGKSIQQMLTFDEQKSKELQQEVDKERELYSKIGSPTAAGAGQLVGDIATFAIPGAGAAKALGYAGKASSAAAKLGSALKAVTPANKLGKLALGGSVGGALGGATVPTGERDSRAKNVAVGAALGAILAPSASLALNKLVKPGVSKLQSLRKRGAEPKLDTSKPAGKVVKDYVKDAGITSDDLKYAQNTVADFKKQGLDHVAPPMHVIFRNDLMEARFNRLIKSEKAEDYLLKRNVDVANEMNKLSDNMEGLLNLKNTMSNSEMLDVVPKAAGLAMAKAKKVAQDAAKPFYEKASQQQVELSKVNNFMKSPVVSKAMKDLKAIPEYKEMLDDIDASVLKAEPEALKVARVLKQQGAKEYDRIKSKIAPVNRTPEESALVQSFEEADSLVKVGDSTTSLAKLDLLSRSLYNRAAKLRSSYMSEGGDATLHTFAEEKHASFNNLLKELSPELKQAKDTYSTMLEQYNELSRKGVSALAAMDKGNIRSTLKTMNNTKAADFKDVVKALDEVQPNLGKEISKLWLADKLEAVAKTDRNSLRNLASFFVKEDNLRKLRTVIDDPNAQKLFDKIALISKYYARPIAEGVKGGRVGLPIDDLSTRRITESILGKVQGLFTNRHVNLLLDSSKWSPQVAGLLKAKKNRQETLLSLEEALTLLLSSVASKDGIRETKE